MIRKIPDIIDGVNWRKNIPKIRSKDDKDAYNELLKFMDRYITFRESDIDYKRDELRKIFRDLQEKEIQSSHVDFLKKVAPYVERYYDPSIDFKNIHPILLPTRNKKEDEIWTYFRIVVSLVPYRGAIGKNSKFLLWDKTSQTLLGFSSLSSPILRLEDRDRYFGIDKDIRGRYKNIVEYIPNINNCVALYPFSMFTGGKLLTMMMSTPEIFSEYEKRWGLYPFGLHTTSIYGKSIQYDRIREWKFLGYTKGFGNIHYSGVNIQKIVRWLSKHYNFEIPKYEIGKMSIQLIEQTLDLSSLEVPIWYHGVKRGIYGFRLIDDTNKIGEWIEGKYRRIENKVYQYKDLSYHHFDNQDNKFKFWKERWFRKRYEKYKNNLKDIDYTYYLPEYLNVSSKQTYLDTY